MRSKTSLCNAALFKKNFTRFALLWAGGTLFFLVCLFLTIFGQYRLEGIRLVDELSDLFQCSHLITCGYAFLAAMLLFGDLYSSQLCDTLHAMPIRRSSYYCTAVICGILFFLIPSGVMGLLALPSLLGTVSAVPNAAMLSLYCFLEANLQYLFFFGLASLCAVCVGSRLGLGLSYFLLNVAGYGLYMLADLLFTPLLPGVVTPYAPFSRLCPVLHFSDHKFIALEYDRPSYSSGILRLGEGWSCLFLFAGLGLVMLLAGLAIYRRRNLETAGDLLSVKALRPLALFAMALAAGTLMVALEQSTIEATWAAIGFLLLGLAMGWFGGLMLIHRSSRVFNLSAFRGLGLLILAAVVSMGVTKLDPLGIASRIPQAQEIESIDLDCGLSFQFTDPEGIEDMLRLHRLGLQSQDAGLEQVGSTSGAYYLSGDVTLAYRLTYLLKDGQQLRRVYSVKNDTEAAAILNKLLNKPTNVFGQYEKPKQELTEEQILQKYAGTPQSIYISGTSSPMRGYLPGEYLTEQTVEALVRAVLADCADQTIAQHSALHPVTVGEDGQIYFHSYWLAVDLIQPDYGVGSFSLNFYPDSSHVLAWLETVGIDISNLDADTGLPITQIEFPAIP